MQTFTSYHYLEGDTKHTVSVTHWLGALINVTKSQQMKQEQWLWLWGYKDPSSLIVSES